MKTFFIAIIGLLVAISLLGAVFTILGGIFSITFGIIGGVISLVFKFLSVPAVIVLIIIFLIYKFSKRSV